MKKILLLLIFMSLQLHAQVGVNTTNPDPSSMLDVSATNKGVLVPRVSLANVTTTMLDGTNTAATGLLIWNTNAATVGGNGVGFYFFNGTQWMPITQTSSSDHDIYEVGGTTAPNNISDNKYTQGTLTIGTNTAATGVLDVDNATKTTSVDINNTFATNPTGIDLNLTSNAAGKTGVKTQFNGTAATGTNSFIQNTDNMVGNTNRTAISNDFSGTSSSISTSITGLKNDFKSTSNYYAVLYGVNNSFASTTNAWGYGMLNSFTNGGTTPSYGVVNGFNGTSTGSATGILNSSNNYNGSVTGMENSFSGTGNGIHYGISNSLTGTGTGDKYGIYNYIPNTAGGTHYGLYSNVLKAGSYAGYFLGNVAIGTTALNNYILPASRGTNGQIMQTDGSGNVSWTTPTDTDTDNQQIDVLSLTGDTLNISLQDDAVATQTLNLSTIDNQTTDVFNLTGNTLNLSLQNDGVATQTVDLSPLKDDDWYEVGGTSQPNAITDNIYKQGTVTIGTNTAATGVLDIDNTSKTTSLDINNTYAANPVGVNIDINTTSANKTGIAITQSGTFTGLGGVGSMIQTIDNCSGNYNRFIMYNVFNGICTDTNINAYGMRNAFSSNSFVGDFIGVANDDYSTANGNRYGMTNIYSATGNGINYGVYNYYSGTGTGTKYGIYNNILSTAGGTHYGIYSNVLKAGSYAGYFLGNVSIGTSAFNNYILPASRGTNGQIMQTDGSGNLTWVNPVVDTDTDDQATDVFSLTGNTLNLSLQNDGIATQTVDLSSLKDADWFEVGGTSQPNAITDDKFSFGNLSIGKNTTAVSKVDIEAQTKTSTLTLNNNNTTSGTKTGLNNSLNLDTANAFSSGIQNSVTGNANYRYGLNNILSGSITGAGPNYEFGIKNSLFSSGNVQSIGVFNDFYPAAGHSGEYLGIYNDIGGSNHTGGFTGIQNNANYATNNPIIGLENTLGGTGNGIRAGVSNSITASNSADAFGTMTYITGAGTGNKYGERVIIQNSAGGTHYGVYSDVTKANSFAGYFLGNVAVGTTTINNYILPASRGTNGQIMQTDGAGNVSWATPSIAGSLDDAYDFGGSGSGRNITADSGAVTISGTDGLVATGTFGSGSVSPTGGGTKMYWNPRKAAFRAGYIFSNQWDNANLGDYSTAFGWNTIASGYASTALGSATASGSYSFAVGGLTSIASGTNSIALNGSASSSSAIAIGGYATGISSVSVGNSTASGNYATSFGLNNVASGNYATALGIYNSVSGENAIAFGYLNSAKSYSETVLGIGATNYTPSVNGDTTANPTDRLFVIGNALDTNSNGLLDLSERSDAIVILKNGETGLGMNPVTGSRLAVSGKTQTTNFQMTSGALGGYILQSDATGNATWVNPTTLSTLQWKIGGNSGTIAGTDYIGTNDPQDFDFRTNGVLKLRLTQKGQLSVQNTGGSVFVGANAGDSDDLTNNQNTFVGSSSGQLTTTGNLNTAIGHSSLGTNVDGLGNTGIGRSALTTNVSGSNNTSVGRLSDVSTASLSNATAIGFNASVNASDKVRLGNAAITVVEGQVAYTNPSDARFKFNIKENVPGLDFIKKLKPVTYHFDTKKFENHLHPNIKEKVTDIDYSKSTAIVHTGFLAQDVEKICRELGYDFDGLHIPDANNPTDNYGVAYSQFIMPMVKAVQEQQVIIENQKNELEQLKSELNQLKLLEKRLEILEKTR